MEGIPIKSGTVQGDSLSPFLFLLFIEPLLRWLEVGNRGYKIGMRDGNVEYANAAAYADDLSVPTDNISQLQIQTIKLDKYCEWTGLVIAAQKCTVTGILHNAQHEGMPQRATDWKVLKPMLEQITLNGSQVKMVQPGQPFKFLGVLFTLTLDWLSVSGS